MDSKIYHSSSIEDLSVLSAQILTDCQQSRIFTFYGQLGAGKTTLIKSLCVALGYQEDVTSPTFSLVNEYTIAQNKIYHMDLYRLKNIEEALDIGLEEYLYSGYYCFIEWPQVAIELLSEPYYVIKIEVEKNRQRKIEISFVV
jgi:tRNA threonylcarbamoyladenosine biosynthesis protein TsaE